MDASGHSYANGAMVFAAMEVEGSVVRRKRTRSHEEASNARTRDAASGDTTVAGVVAAARTITAVVLEGRTGSLIIARHMSNAINRFHLEIQRFKHRGHSRPRRQQISRPGAWERRRRTRQTYPRECWLCFSSSWNPWLISRETRAHLACMLTRKHEAHEKAKAVKEAPKKDVAESSAQGEARGTNTANAPRCYRCLNRGHAKDDCTATLLCDICESPAHVKGRCPLLKKAKPTYALTCGYAVDGLGFYYIPTAVAVRPRPAAKHAIVRVLEGVLNATQIKAELTRLVPSKLTWEVEEVEPSVFKTVFPSKNEMQPMIEWGILHIKNSDDTTNIHPDRGPNNYDGP
jgi:hypothetical protein